MVKYVADTCQVATTACTNMQILPKNPLKLNKIRILHFAEIYICFVYVIAFVFD